MSDMVWYRGSFLGDSMWCPASEKLEDNEHQWQKNMGSSRKSPYPRYSRRWFEIGCNRCKCLLMQLGSHWRKMVEM